MRRVGWGPDLRGSLGRVGWRGACLGRRCLGRRRPGGLQGGEVRLPEVGDLRPAVPLRGPRGLPGRRHHDLGVLGRLGQAAGAAEVQDGDQHVLLDEPQRLEGQDTLDVLLGDNNSPR